MGKTQIIFLRHADTEKNPNINAALWGLSEKGIEQAKSTSLLNEMKSIDIIYTSEEQKTNLTANPIANNLKKTMTSLSFFDEVKRGDKFLSKEEFEQEKWKQLEDLNYPAFNGETGIEALKRFKDGISKIIEENKGNKILVVTHGTILNIYFADILKKEKELINRWKNTKFCAYGIVEFSQKNTKILKDII